MNQPGKSKKQPEPVRRRPLRDRPLRALAALGMVGVLTGCSVGLEQLPLPAPSVGTDTYRLTATFANALNLPAKAKVRLSGADVGGVESMTARDYTAVVTMRIAAGVQIPAGTRAELRSATPLGDVFVALTPLPPGAELPADSTASAATVEDVLSTAALLVNGGAIRNLTRIVNGMGRVVGGKGEDLNRFVDDSTRLVRSLSARSEAIKAALTRTGDLAALLAERQRSIDAALAAAAPALGAVGDNTDRIVELSAQLNRIALQLAKLPSVRGEESRSMLADINTISHGLNEASLAPGASLHNFNRMFGPILKTTNSTAANVEIDLADLAVGAFADPYHPADPGSRGMPTREDFRNLVGSISYELLMVRNKFWGPPTPPPGNVPPPNLIGPAPDKLTPAPPPPGLKPPPPTAPPGASLEEPPR